MPFCSSCGTKIQEDMKFCPECGRRFVLEQKEATQEKPKDARSSTIVIERAEPTYYSDEKGVRITPTRLIIGSSTYAMANISSIKTATGDPSRWAGIVMALFGLFFIGLGFVVMSLGGSVSVTVFAAIVFLMGIAVLGGGIAWAVLVKPTYHLRISSASGETDALMSKDKDYIAHVATALNEALIKRG